MQGSFFSQKKKSAFRVPRQISVNPFKPFFGDTYPKNCNKKRPRKPQAFGDAFFYAMK